LFNVEDDVREMNDLALSMPELLSSMVARYKQLYAAMSKPNGHEDVPMTFDGVNFVLTEPAAADPCCDKMKETGFFAPWE
jgi:hypothetical protein